MSRKHSVFQPFWDGLFQNNPTFIQLLGMCPTLAITNTVTNALGMGLAATAVLVCSNILISLLRKFIPRQIRIAAFIVIISGFVTAVELLMRAYVRPLYATLGLYIPLIVVNCIILARAEAFASKNGVLPSVMDGLGCGLGFTGGQHADRSSLRGAGQRNHFRCANPDFIQGAGTDFCIQRGSVFHARLPACPDSGAAAEKRKEKRGGAAGD